MKQIVEIVILHTYTSLINSQVTPSFLLIAVQESLGTRLPK